MRAKSATLASRLKDLSSANFGLVIADLLPGFIALWGASYFPPTPQLLQKTQKAVVMLRFSPLMLLVVVCAQPATICTGGGLQSGSGRSTLEVDFSFSLSEFSVSSASLTSQP